MLKMDAIDVAGRNTSVRTAMVFMLALSLRLSSAILAELLAIWIFS
jgi:hypothetical protein